MPDTVEVTGRCCLQACAQAGGAFWRTKDDIMQEQHASRKPSYRPVFIVKLYLTDEEGDTDSERSTADAVSSGSSSHNAVERSASSLTSEGMKKGDSERITIASSCAIASEMRVVSTEARTE